MNVRPLRDTEAEQWDAFVRDHPSGTPFHLTAWKRAVERVFRLEPHYLVAESGNRWAGVLPLFMAGSLLTGRVLVSSPFAVYGGALAMNEDARAEFKRSVTEMAEERNVQYVELRNSFEEQCLGWPRISRYVTFIHRLAASSDDELLSSLPMRTRNRVRKSLRYPYESRVASDLDAFFDLMARTYRRLGSPIFPRAWFETLRRELGDLVDFREVWLDGAAVAASMNLLFRGEMHNYYTGSAPEAWDKSPNNFLYFDHLRWAARNGYQAFDFGRSKKESGNFEFKRHWPTEIRELPYEILLVRRRDLPDFSPKNPRFQLAIRIWQRLPLAVTRMLGPHLVRLFP